MTDLHATDPLVRPAHLALLTGYGEITLNKLVKAGKLPPHDLRGAGQVRLWKLSTLRSWNPAMADSLESLLKHPALGSIKIAA
ncbi:MAG: hypothetical protein IPM11_01585 [Micropruina sp.]|nr:hypothetical protein [Micropruina sp.]